MNTKPLPDLLTHAMILAQSAHAGQRYAFQFQGSSSTPSKQRRKLSSTPSKPRNWEVWLRRLRSGRAVSPGWCGISALWNWRSAPERSGFSNVKSR